MSVDLDARLPKTAGHRSNWPDSKTQHRRVGQILWAEAVVNDTVSWRQVCELTARQQASVTWVWGLR